MSCHVPRTTTCLRKHMVGGECRCAHWSASASKIVDVTSCSEEPVGSLRFHWPVVCALPIRPAAFLNATLHPTTYPVRMVRKYMRTICRNSSPLLPLHIGRERRGMDSSGRFPPELVGTGGNEHEGRRIAPCHSSFPLKPINQLNTHHF